jgi:hypothetical protein
MNFLLHAWFNNLMNNSEESGNPSADTEESDTSCDGWASWPIIFQIPCQYTSKPPPPPFRMCCCLLLNIYSASSDGGSMEVFDFDFNPGSPDFLILPHRKYWLHLKKFIQLNTVRFILIGPTTSDPALWVSSISSTNQSYDSVQDCSICWGVACMVSCHAQSFHYLFLLPAMKA